MKRSFLILFVIAVLGTAFSFREVDEVKVISYVVDPHKADLRLYWKDDKGEIFRSIGNLKSWVEKNKQRLLFAMNAGMYQEDRSPLGLFISNYKELNPLNTRSASGNFYMKPNGVFYLNSSNQAFISKTENFRNEGKVKYATQSGPMLLLDGKIHPDFKEASVNYNIRNGVGILPGGKVIFAMSEGGISFYDFAKWFREQGCQNALYLDGAISKTYVPSKGWIQTGGNFGVIIGVTEKKK